MPNKVPVQDDPSYTAYLASARRGKIRIMTGPPTATARRVRDAILHSEGAHCHICQSHDRLRMAATTGAAWDSAVADRGHAALAGRLHAPKRTAMYACAAASPRVRLYCPRCTPVARLRRHLEALAAAAHGPATRYRL